MKAWYVSDINRCPAMPSNTAFLRILYCLVSELFHDLCYRGIFQQTEYDDQKT